MRATVRPPATSIDHPVWSAISRHAIGPERAALPFERRLARENGWSAAYTARVMEEYRRFCFLAVVAGCEVTPSDAVDQAWHLHLTYTRDYWERFCPEVLGRPLHHGPTRGGEAERARFYDQYAATLAAYERVFGEASPADIWPDARRRLLEDPRARRVHPRDGVVVPRTLFRLLELLVVGALMAAWLS